MGHIHLGRLPATKKWKQVVELLATAASVDAVARASAIATEREFERIAGDPVFVEAVRLLSMIPQAAKSDDFTDTLYDLGVVVPSRPLLSDLLTGTTVALDRFAADNGIRSDTTSLVARALVATLTTHAGSPLPSLFEPEAADVKVSVARLGNSDQFSRAARTFFEELMSGMLSYYLDRVLSAHVGPDQIFKDIGDRARFSESLDQYCSEATRIIEEFSGGWYGKTLWREGTITHDRAAAFGAVALKKIGEELRRKRSADD